jgi:hypothetical protein
MKRSLIFFFLAAAAVGVITVAFFIGNESTVSPTPAHATTPPKRSPASLSSIEAAITANDTRAHGDLAKSMEALLDILYEAPSASARLAAAQEIARQGNERAFDGLATFVAAAESTGEESLLSLATQVADVLGQMHGEAIHGIATELAYSPSALVAEAAVNAVVPRTQLASPLGPQPLTTEIQGDLDAQAQALFQPIEFGAP